MPAALTWNLPVALVFGSISACIGGLCAFLKSKWWCLLIPLWWVGGTWVARYLVTDIAFLGPRDINVFSIYALPIIGYYAMRGIIEFERSDHPQSAYFVQWSDGLGTAGHIDDPTTEQILAEFDKLDGSKRSTLRIQEGLKRVDICVVDDDLTVFYHTDNHKRKDPGHAVYPPGQTQEGEYYGPFGGYEEIEFPLYVFISKADSRRALEEFLITRQRPQTLLWLDCETESDLPLPPWG